VHNYIGFERYRVVSTQSVPTGKVTLTFDFKYDGGGMGKGGTITLLANGGRSARAARRKTTPLKYSLYEGQDIGRIAAHLSFHLHAAVSVYGASCTKSPSS